MFVFLSLLPRSMWPVSSFLGFEITAALVAISFAYLIEIMYSQWYNVWAEEMEDRVCAELVKLPEGYVVIPNLNIGGEDIDVVVVGPTGIWIVEVKSWRKPVVDVDGRFLVRVYGGERIQERSLQQLSRQWSALQRMLFNRGIHERSAQTALVLTHDRAKILDRAKRMTDPMILRADRIREAILNFGATELSRSEVIATADALRPSQPK